MCDIFCDICFHCGLSGSLFFAIFLILGFWVVWYCHLKDTQINQGLNMMSSVFRLIGYSQPIHDFLRAPWNCAEVYNINLLLRKISIDTFGALMVTLMVTFYFLMVPFLVICALLMVTFPWYGNYELILGFVILEFGIRALLLHSGYATACNNRSSWCIILVHFRIFLVQLFCASDFRFQHRTPNRYRISKMRNHIAFHFFGNLQLSIALQELSAKYL